MDSLSGSGSWSDLSQLSHPALSGLLYSTRAVSFSDYSLGLREAFKVRAQSTSRSTSASGGGGRGRRFDVFDAVFSLLVMLGFYLEGASFSIVPPFFPSKSRSHDLDLLETAAIMGCYDIGNILFSFVVPTVIQTVPAKVLFAGGLLTTAAPTLALGFICSSHSARDLGLMFLVLTGMCRLLSGIGAALIWGTGAAMLSVQQPKHSAILVSLAQCWHSIGLITGPPIGGLLLQVHPLSASSYMAPFLTFGLLGLAMFGCFLLGSFINKTSTLGDLTYPFINTTSLALDMTFFKFVSTLRAQLLLSLAFVISVSMGVLDVGLGFYLRHHIPNLTTTQFGAIFAIVPCWATLISPALALIADVGYAKYLLSLSPLCFGCGYVLFVLPHAAEPAWKLEEIIRCVGVLLLIGTGSGISMASFSKSAASHALDLGYPDGLKTRSCIASIFNLTFSIGKVVGLVGVGAAAIQSYDTLQASALITAVLFFISGSAYALHLSVSPNTARSWPKDSMAVNQVRYRTRLLNRQPEYAPDWTLVDLADPENEELVRLVGPATN